MTDTPIRHVTDTAHWVATYRAIESERPDRLFEDPLAARLVEGRGRAIAAQMPDGGVVQWTLAIRTRLIDERIAQAAGDGCDTILNLGAGLDTRPYRLALPPELRWIEVDFPETIDFKEARLAGERPRCRLERVRLDLGDQAARQALLRDVDASARRVFVLTEGVVPYLTGQQVAALADELRACAHVESWMLEYFTDAFVQARRRRRHARAKKMANAPLRFRPGDWNAFFAAHGWAAGEIRYLGLEARRLGRRPPLPFWRWLRLLLLSPARRRALAEQYGYAVLRRA